MKTINDFIKELQRISPDKRELPLIIFAPNGTEVSPSIKMRFKDDNFLAKDAKVVQMVITWQ